MHWKGARGLTYCRRKTKGMKRSFDGSLFVDCEACKDLRRITNRNYIEIVGS